MNELNEKALEEVSGGADQQIRPTPSDPQSSPDRDLIKENTETVLR